MSLGRSQNCSSIPAFVSLPAKPTRRSCVGVRVGQLMTRSVSSAALSARPVPLAGGQSAFCFLCTYPDASLGCVTESGALVVRPPPSFVERYSGSRYSPHCRHRRKRPYLSDFSYKSPLHRGQPFSQSTVDTPCFAMRGAVPYPSCLGEEDNPSTTGAHSGRRSTANPNAARSFLKSLDSPKS